ncbi:MAG: hypothetical protein RIN56_11175 [Sporomusaceae bacterium]|nr:hypothetical protein [Sporomusaceae bacterium]
MIEARVFDEEAKLKRVISKTGDYVAGFGFVIGVYRNGCLNASLYGAADFQKL